MYSALLRKIFLPYVLKRDNRQSALDHRRTFEESQYWPRQKLLDYQWMKLKKLLQYSYENCAYYKDIFDERGLNPGSFKSFDDLSRLPILTRDIIYDQGERLLSTAMPAGSIMKFSTGGTTGQQADMYRDQESYNQKLAIEWRHESWMGREPCDKMVFFWPAHIDIVEHMTFKTRIKSRYILRQIVFNAGTFREDAMLEFSETLFRFKAPYFKVFPASLYRFLDFLEDHGLKAPKLAGVLSCGEPLYDYQRRRFEAFFACRVFNMYGSREVGNTACECASNEGMHIAMETSVVEFLKDNRAVDYGQDGEIIITDLTNYAMPLLRYRIDDHGIPIKGSCSCGRTLPLMGAVVGRLNDDFWGPDGTRHIGNVLITHLSSGREGINIGQSQFIQKTLNHFHVRLTNKPEPTPEIFQYLTRRMKDIIGDEITVTYEIVDEIPREESGKIRSVKCEIAPPGGSGSGP